MIKIPIGGLKKGAVTQAPDTGKTLNIPVSNLQKMQAVPVDQPAPTPQAEVKKENPFVSFVKGLVTPYTQPSEKVKEVEKLYGVGEATQGTVSTAGQKVYDVIAKGAIRTFGPLLEPLGTDIGEAIAVNDIAPKVASGELPPEALDQLDSLKKSNLQVAGDVAQAVLAVYSPTYLKEGAVILKDKPIVNALLTGAIRGGGIGAGFGGAQVLSSGTTDVKQIASTMGQNIAIMGILGAVTSGLIPVSAKVLKKSVEIKETIKADEIKKGATPEQAEVIANRAGVKPVATAKPINIPVESVKKSYPAEPSFVPEPTPAADIQVEPVVPTIDESVPGITKPSKIGQSIEAKSVEQKLTTGFKSTAEYEPVKVAEQARISTDLVNSDITSARKMINGEADLPPEMRGISLITAMEEYIKKNPDPDMAYDLANSPLVRGTSVAAQELRLAAERTPDSATSKIIDLKKERESKVKDFPAKKTAEKKRLKDEAGKINLPKEELSWDRFLEGITC